MIVKRHHTFASMHSEALHLDGTTLPAMRSFVHVNSGVRKKHSAMLTSACVCLTSVLQNHALCIQNSVGDAFSTLRQCRGPFKLNVAKTEFAQTPSQYGCQRACDTGTARRALSYKRVTGPFSTSRQYRSTQHPECTIGVGVFHARCEILTYFLICCCRTALIPFVADFIPSVDVAGGRMEITPPEGLLDVTRSKAYRKGSRTRG